MNEFQSDVPKFEENSVQPCYVKCEWVGYIVMCRGYVTTEITLGHTVSYSANPNIFIKAYNVS